MQDNKGESVVFDFDRVWLWTPETNTRNWAGGGKLLYEQSLSVFYFRYVLGPFGIEQARNLFQAVLDRKKTLIGYARFNDATDSVGQLPALTDEDARKLNEGSTFLCYWPVGHCGCYVAYAL